MDTFLTRAVLHATVAGVSHIIEVSIQHLLLQTHQISTTRRIYQCTGQPGGRTGEMLVELKEDVIKCEEEGSCGVVFIVQILVQSLSLINPVLQRCIDSSFASSLNVSSISLECPSQFVFNRNARIDWSCNRS